MESIDVVKALIAKQFRGTVPVLVTPEIAAELLKTEGPNRKSSKPTVASYACDMKNGHWHGGATPICFDVQGRLRDGGHRLRAIVLANVSVRLDIRMGMSDEEIACLDGGRTRKLADKLSIMRVGEANLSRRISYLNAAISILRNGGSPALRTLDSFDHWMTWFRTGVDGASRTLSVRSFSASPVGGAVAFAWATRPKECEDFASLLCDSTGRAVPLTVATTRNFLLSGKNLRAHGNHALSRKILNALLAHVDGRPLAKLADGDNGLNYFRKIYDELGVDPLSRP